MGCCDCCFSRGQWWPLAASYSFGDHRRNQLDGRQSEPLQSRGRPAAPNDGPQWPHVRPGNRYTAGRANYKLANGLLVLAGLHLAQCNARRGPFFWARRCPSGPCVVAVSVGAAVGAAMGASASASASGSASATASRLAPIQDNGEPGSGAISIIIIIWPAI